MPLNRETPFSIPNHSAFAILVKVDEDDFVLPPGAWLQSNGTNAVYLAFAGDAPMVAVPIASNAPGRPDIGRAPALDPSHLDLSRLDLCHLG